MPRYINPHRGIVMVQGPNGVIKVRPGMVVDLPEAQAARTGLVPTSDDDAGRPDLAAKPKAAPAIPTRRSIPPQAAAKHSVPVAEPKLPAEPEIVAAPVAEEKPPEAPLPAAEPAASDPAAGLTEPAPAEPPVDEKAADAVAQDLLGKPAQEAPRPRKGAKKDKGEPRAAEQPIEAPAAPAATTEEHEPEKAKE